MLFSHWHLTDWFPSSRSSFSLIIPTTVYSLTGLHNSYIFITPNPRNLLVTINQLVITNHFLGVYMVIVHQNPNKSAMTVMSQDEIDTLEKAIQLTDPHVFISKINYDIGTVSIGFHYNEGTPNAFDENDFLTINVASDSVPAAFKDVFNRVYDRCMY